jgi:ubiquinone/menaquinone biosynthesis C-methylase UbiE
MDMRKLTFKDKTFDGIRACASFLHIPKEEAEKTLQEFFRVLKKE